MKRKKQLGETYEKRKGEMKGKEIQDQEKRRDKQKQESKERTNKTEE